LPIRSQLHNRTPLLQAQRLDSKTLGSVEPRTGPLKMQTFDVHPANMAKLAPKFGGDRGQLAK